MDPYLGQTLGSMAPIAGQAIGMAVAGPIGAMAGKATGQIINTIAGQASAMKLKKQAEAMAPPKEDPRQLARLAQLQQMQRSLLTGTGAQTQAAKGAAEQGIAGTQSAISRMAGGNVGSTIQGLLQAQRVGGSQINEAMATGAQQGMQMNPLIDALNNAIAQRKLELQLAEQQQKMPEWANMQQQTGQNLRAGMARTDKDLGKIFQDLGIGQNNSGPEITTYQ